MGRSPPVSAKPESSSTASTGSSSTKSPSSNSSGCSRLIWPSRRGDSRRSARRCRSFQKDVLVKELRKAGADKDVRERLLFAEHHYSHAASAFFPSPFEEALVLTIDGVGEWATSTVAVGRGNRLAIEKELHFPHSLGLLYSAFTYYTGFKVNSGEYKVMGLAPYGEPRFKHLILDKIVDLKEDGTFRLDQSYFNYCTGLTMTNGRLADLFCEPGG